MMDDDGSVSSKDRYNDIGKDRFVANIGHVWSEDVVNNSMVEYPLNLKEGQYSSISLPYDFEIIGSFLINYNIIVNKWIDCNDTAGIFDNGIGKWTGAVGQVKIQLHYNLYV